MKKRFLAGILAIACSLSLVGCDGGFTENFKNIIGDTSKTPMQVTIVNHPVEAKLAGDVKATGAYSEVILSDDTAENFQNLKNALDDYNSSWAESTKSSVADYGYFIEEYPEDYEAGYDESTNLTLVRADSKLFSLLGNCYYYTGGAHPSHYTFSINLDTNTGHPMTISEVVTDTSKLADVIRQKVYDKYPENKEEIENYFICNCASEKDAFETYLEEDTYTWTLTDEGLHIYFSPYEIASYATGDMDVVITEDDLPGLIQDSYELSAPQDLAEIVTYEDAELTMVDTHESDYEDSSYEETENAVSISNPTFDRYISDKAKPAASKHITLTETSKDVSDWLDTDAWATKNGFDTPFLSYGDGNYYYAPGDGGDWGYEYTTLFLYDAETNDLLHTYDLETLCNGPDDTIGTETAQRLYIHWAKAMDGVLYVSLAHSGYASEESRTGYMVAIDMKTDSVLWRSDALLCNSNNFQIVDDTIICGYGFTSEPDYLYLLDKNTGDKVDQIELESAPFQFEIVDDTLYLATYNTAYTYKINR